MANEGSDAAHAGVRLDLRPAQRPASRSVRVAHGGGVRRAVQRDEFSDIEAWAKERIDWLRGFLVLEHGIPSHDSSDGCLRR